jgi:alginate O-acetyltransferase complex protein AlgI
MITMLLGGLWHGAAWTFVLWGFYQGALLMLYRPIAGRVEKLSGPLSRFAAWLVMFHLTCYGWLIFRASSFGALRDLTRSLFARFSPGSLDVSGLAVPLLLYTAPLLIVHAYEAWSNDVLAVPKLGPVLRYTVYVATMYLILLFGNFGGSDFIYFQF